jgi:hypothetical protein
VDILSSDVAWRGFVDAHTPLRTSVEVVLRAVADGVVDVVPATRVPSSFGDGEQGTVSLAAVAAASDTVGVADKVRALPRGAALVACVRAVSAAGLASAWVCTDASFVVAEYGRWRDTSTLQVGCGMVV